jgi:ribonucleotide reductase beta subunit family protein with ferritin-like domain
MFYDLKDAWENMLKKASYIADDSGIHITFPQHLFDRLEQEFNICFIEEDEDIHFKLWQNEDEDYGA